MHIDDSPRGLRLRCHPHSNPERAGTIYATSKRLIGRLLSNNWIERLMKMAINPATQDLYGREVDGWFWALLEEGFSNCALKYRASGHEHAASIADRLAETAHELPAQLMKEFQDLWDDVADYPD